MVHCSNTSIPLGRYQSQQTHPCESGWLENQMFAKGLREMKKPFLCLCFSLAASTYAATNSNVSTIQQLTIGDTYARIKLAAMTAMEGCTDQSYYYLDLSNNKNRGVLSAALTAKTTQSPVIVQGDGCLNNYPLVSHLYLN